MSPSSTRRPRGSGDSQNVPGAFRGDMQAWFRESGGGPRDGGAGPVPGVETTGRGRRGGAAGRHRRAAGEVSVPLPEPTSLWGFTGRYGSGRESSPDGHAEARNTLAAGGWTPAARPTDERPRPGGGRPAETTGSWRSNSSAAALSGPIETTVTGSWRVRAAGDAVAEQRDRDWDAAGTGQQAALTSTGSWPQGGSQAAPPEATGSWARGGRAEVVPVQPNGARPRGGSPQATPDWHPRPALESGRGGAADWQSAVGWNGAPAAPEPAPAPQSGQRRAPEVGYGAGPGEASGSWPSDGRRRAPALESASWRPAAPAPAGDPDWRSGNGRPAGAVEAGPWSARRGADQHDRRDSERSFNSVDSTTRGSVLPGGRPGYQQPALESGSRHSAPADGPDWRSANGYSASPPAAERDWRSNGHSAGPSAEAHDWRSGNGRSAGPAEYGSWQSNGHSAGPPAEAHDWRSGNGHSAGPAEYGSWHSGNGHSAGPPAEQRDWRSGNGHSASRSGYGSGRSVEEGDWRSGNGRSAADGGRAFNSVDSASWGSVPPGGRPGYQQPALESGSRHAAPADERDWRSATGRHAAAGESTGSWRTRPPAAGAVARQLAAGREAYEQSATGTHQAMVEPARQPAPTAPPTTRRRAQLALPAAPSTPSRDWRQDTGTGEWPTTEWTRAGRAPAEWRSATPGPATVQATRQVAARRATGQTALEPASAALPRVLGAVRPDGRPVPLDEHLQAYGRLPELDEERATDTLLRLVAQSGLRGRGGAGYPVEKKMQAVVAAKGKSVVVVNGAAGDPTSEKDAFLLTRVPHLVLDGAQTAAQAVGARQVLVYVVARPRVYGVVERAVAERRRAQLDAVPVRLVPAPDTYVAGESSAAAQHLSGGPALPMFQPPHTAERGVKGRPTLVQNVETLANLALLVRYGARWFRTVGTLEEPGTLVLTVRGAVPRPVVIEVPVGTTVEQALAGAGGMTEPVGAVLVGGCMGRWLPAASALPAQLSHAGMAAAGGVLGVNSVFALPDRACGLHETARLVRYLAAETAGQCGACVNGLPAIATALTELAESRADQATVQRLYRWCGMVAGRGACNHPDGVVALVGSALQVFADEGGRHLGGWCSRPLRTVLPLPATADRPAGLSPNRPVRAPGRPAQEPLGWDEERYGPWSTGPQLQLTSRHSSR